MSKRFPGGAAGVGKELTQFGNALAGKQHTLINSEWQEIALGDNFVGISLEDSKYLLENIERIEGQVVFVFDFAITAISLYRDFLFFLPNFMNAVITYLAGILYNALDSFLRLGMYALVVPPNLADTSYKGLPTTSLKEQADNAYKKFYDVSDPNIPYYLPFEKGLAEKIIDDGEKIKNKLKYYFEDSAISHNLSGGKKKAYMERDFLDFKKSVENLSIPMGFYDAIYLYFAVSYEKSSTSKDNFIKAIAKIADLFKFPTIEGLLKEYDSLFRPKRKRVKILCVDKIAGLDKSMVSNAKDDLKRIDMETTRRNYQDPKLENWRIFESDPIASMTPDRKRRIKAAFEKQLMYDKLYKEQLNEQGLDELVEFRLKTNSQFQTLKEDILALEDEVQYYDYKEYVRTALDGTDKYDYEGFHQKLKTNEKHFTQLNNVSAYPNAAAFQSEREVYYKAFDAYQNAKDKDNAMVKANALNNMMRSQARLFKMGENIRNEVILSFTPPDLAQTERIQKLTSKLSEEQTIRQEVTKNTQEFLNTDLTDRINKIIKSKEEQIKYLDGISGSTNVPYSENDLQKSAQLTYLGNYYPNSGRASLYESYMEKFYNFNTVADVDYMYDFIIEVDATDGEFSTKIDSFHSGQYVQIRQKLGGNWHYRGAGIIVADVTEHFSDAGVGTWVKANFSDIIGLTADIKRLQNEILGFQNLFEPNTTAFDAIINFLKDVKRRILDLISILKDLIQIIQLLLSISLAGKVIGKYIRERDYDQMTIGLCDTSKLPPQTTKRTFKPSRLATVQYWLAKIRDKDRQRAADIADDIDTLFTKTDSADDTFRKDHITNKSVVQESYPVKAAMYQTSQQLKHSVKLELDKKVDSVLNLFDTSTSAVVNWNDNVGFVPQEDAEKIDLDNELNFYESKIYAELAKAESNLTNEFGFSLILLSYLPQGIPFYPVRFLAEKLGLIEQDIGIVGNQIKANQHGTPSGNRPDSLDPGIIAGLMPNKTPDDLVKIMTRNSIARNPAVKYTPQPIYFNVKFNELLCTSEFNFTLKPILDGTIKGEVGYSIGTHHISVTESLRTRYLAGALITNTDGSPITLTTDKALNTNYKYLYEVTLDTGLGSQGCGNSNEIGKLQVHLGGFPYAASSSTGDAFLHTHRKGYERNSDGNTIFRFGRMYKKTFQAEIYVKQDTTQFLPYILIGYDEDQKLNTFPSFKLEKGKIKFYRIA